MASKVCHINFTHLISFDISGHTITLPTSTEMTDPHMVPQGPPELLLVTELASLSLLILDYSALQGRSEFLQQWLIPLKIMMRTGTGCMG